MLIKYNEIHGTHIVKYYDLRDVVAFGKNNGKSLEYLIDRNPSYVWWMLDKLGGFGLNEDSMDYYLRAGHEYEYPPEKIFCEEHAEDDESERELAERDFEEEFDVNDSHIPARTKVNLKPKVHYSQLKQIKTFQPILGVNTMKKAILVNHDNTYIDSRIQGRQYHDDNGKGYAYLTNMDDLEINDFVVVDCANGLQVCRVTKLIGLTANQINKASAWVVSKVDLAQHDKNLQAQEKIQEIQNKVAERKSQIEGQVILAQMAESDPTMKSLLQELGSLDENLVPSSLLVSNVTSNDGA